MLFITRDVSAAGRALSPHAYWEMISTRISRSVRGQLLVPFSTDRTTPILENTELITSYVGSEGCTVLYVQGLGQFGKVRDYNLSHVLNMRNWSNKATTGATDEQIPSHFCFFSDFRMVEKSWPHAACTHVNIYGCYMQSESKYKTHYLHTYIL